MRERLQVGTDTRSTRRILDPLRALIQFLLGDWSVVEGLEAETGRGIYVYSSCLCLLVTALSFTTTAGSDKFKEFARVGVFSTVITKFNWVNCWKHNIFQHKCVFFGIIDIFSRQIPCMELSPHVKYNSRCNFICYQQFSPQIFLPTVLQPSPSIELVRAS